jgi:hypothetical protein
VAAERVIFLRHLMKSFLLFAFLFLVQSSQAQVQIRSYDLQKDWLIFIDGGYTAYQPKKNVETVYVPFDEKMGVGDYLVVQTSQPVAIFLNSKLVSTVLQTDTLSIDRLRSQHSLLSFTLTFYAPSIERAGLSTHLITPTLIATAEPLAPQPPTFFRDFSFIATLLILSFLLMIIRLNPKLASDYFSVTKIFSLRESEDSTVYTRITSSGNFLFYGFSSLTLGFFLVLLFDKLPQKEWMSIHSFQQAMGHWLLFSFFITLLLLGKMLVIYLFATLFNLRDVAGMQFFNWVRVLFLSIGVSITILMIVMIRWNDSTTLFQFFYQAIGWLLMVWILLAFFKIATKARIGLFHLFSYLCATEIIPSLIVLKILYY